MGHLVRLKPARSVLSHVRKEGLIIRAGERFRYSRVEGMIDTSYADIIVIFTCYIGWGGVADELLSYTGVPDSGYCKYYTVHCCRIQGMMYAVCCMMYAVCCMLKSEYSILYKE